MGRTRAECQSGQSGNDRTESPNLWLSDHAHLMIPFFLIYITFKPRVSFQLQIFHKTCLACNVYKYVLGFYYLRDHFRAQGARSFSVQEVSIRRGIHTLPLRVLRTGLSRVTRDKPENGFRTTILKYAIKEKSALELHLNAGQINK